MVYLGITLVLALAFVGMIVTGARLLRSRGDDFASIRRYVEPSTAEHVEIKRVSNLRRLLLGGVFEISNLARIYKVVVHGDGDGDHDQRFFVAFDALSGQTKIRKGSRWSSM